KQKYVHKTISKQIQTCCVGRFVRAPVVQWFQGHGGINWACLDPGYPRTGMKLLPRSWWVSSKRILHLCKANVDVSIPLCTVKFPMLGCCLGIPRARTDPTTSRNLTSYFFVSFGS
ncbi:unnamed protein product, partial [Ectocarpus sp. 12 AP-2014]